MRPSIEDQLRKYAAQLKADTEAYNLGKALEIVGYVAAGYQFCQLRTVLGLGTARAISRVGGLL